MADIAFNWAEMESDLLKPSYSRNYLHATISDFTNYKKRNPENIWIFRKKDHRFWILARLTIDETISPPKNVKKNWVTFNPEISEVFMPPVEIREDRKDSILKLFKDMFLRFNGQGAAAATLVENPEVIQLKNLLKNNPKISLSEFHDQLVTGKISGSPYKINSPKAISNKLDLNKESQKNSNSGDANNLENEFDSIEKGVTKLAEILSPTEIDAWVKRRIGQGPFRTKLLSEFNFTCPLSGVSDERLLIASHIRPWSKCNEGQHRDSNNGLLLSITWDALFDKFLISFNDDGKVILSELLDEETLKELGITDLPFLPKKYLTNSRQEYLNYHRSNIYKKKN